jgi:hypothetical protein
VAVIRPEIETDPAELEQIAIQYLKDEIPGWEPAEGDLMTWLIRAHARMVAEERDIAADVPIEQILRPLGEEVHRVLPRAAIAATVDATVTLRDSEGYTVPEGMEVLVRTAGDDGVTMVVVESVTIPPSAPAPQQPTAQVVLRAAPGREGSAANGLQPGTPGVPIRPYEFVESIVLSGVSGGGADAETDEEYLERLVDTLALTSPVPILPEDFAAIARQQPGVERAIAFDRRLRQPEVVEIAAHPDASLTITDQASGDDVTLDPGAAREQVQDAFRAAFGEFEPTVEGGPLGAAPVTVTLDGRASYGPWRVAASGGWGSVAVLHAAVDRVDVERAVTVAVVGPGGANVTEDVRTSVIAALESMRELNWRVTVTDPTPNEIDVSFSAVAWPTYDAEAVRQAAEEALHTHLSAASWGRGNSPGEEVANDWVEDRVVRYLEVAQVLNEVPGLRYVTTLDLSDGTTEPGPNDLYLTGIAPVPKVGTIRSTVRAG